MVRIRTLFFLSVIICSFTFSKAAVRNSFEDKFFLDKTLYPRVQGSSYLISSSRYGISTSDYSFVSLSSIFFEEKDGLTQGILDIHWYDRLEQQNRKMNWLLKIQFLDKENQMLYQEQKLFTIESVKHGKFVHPRYEHTLAWIFPDLKDIYKIEKYRVSLDETKEETKDMLVFKPIFTTPEGLGDITLNIQVVNKVDSVKRLTEMTFWQKISSEEAESRKKNYPESFGTWLDLSTDNYWGAKMSYGAGTILKVHELPLGDYMVVAMSRDTIWGSDPTPWGTTGTIHLDGITKETSINLYLQEGFPVSIKMIDKETHQSVNPVRFYLLREDDFPIGYGSGDYSHYVRDNGTYAFSNLEPGRYKIKIIKKAWSTEQKDYLPENEWIPFQIYKGKENTFEFLLQPMSLTEKEIENRWPFVASGKVIDEFGHPMPDVVIYGYGGMATMFKTCQTKTDKDGKYTLHISPGMRDDTLDPKGRRHTPTQSFIIRPEIKGYYEKNLYRQGDLGLGEEYLSEDTKYWHFNSFILPHKPYSLDFVMMNAITLKGKLIDNHGYYISGQKFVVKSEELPPGSGVLAVSSSVNKGEFSISDLPRKKIWIEMYLVDKKINIKSNMMEFSKPGIYNMEWIYHEEYPNLDCRILSMSPN